MDSIEMFPAGNGDAVLLSLGDTYILIDGGYPSTFRKHLKGRLAALKSAGKHLSRLIVSHVDADHISGMITFLEENGMSQNRNIIDIEQIWHNSYRHLNLEKSKSNDLAENKKFQLPKIAHDDDADIAGGDVSFKQGSTLGGLILKGDYNWNQDFQKHACQFKPNHMIPVGPDVNIRLITPTEEILDTLAKKWLRDLRKIYKEGLNEDKFFDDAFEKMLELVEKPSYRSAGDVSGQKDILKDHLIDWNQGIHEDHSVTNASSISFILEYAGMKMMFLGDAIPGQVVNQLKLMYPAEAFPLQFDFLKVAHHGGITNNSPELFQLVHAEKYLFSSNGKRYYHPHIETLALLLNTKTQKSKKLYFNYPQDRLRFLSDTKWQTKYHYTLEPFGEAGYLKVVV